MVDRTHAAKLKCFRGIARALDVLSAVDGAPPEAVLSAAFVRADAEWLRKVPVRPLCLDARPAHSPLSPRASAMKRSFSGGRRSTAEMPKRRTARGLCGGGDALAVEGRAARCRRR